MGILSHGQQPYKLPALYINTNVEPGLLVFKIKYLEGIALDKFF
ncbi:hypothetical protein [Treponema primitia]